MCLCPSDFLALRTSSMPSSSHTQMSSCPSAEAPDALMPLLSFQHPAALSGSPCWMQLFTRPLGPVRVPWLVGSHRCHQKELVPCPCRIFGYADISGHWGWEGSRCGGGRGLWVSTELPRGPWGEQGPWLGVILVHICSGTWYHGDSRLYSAPLPEW